MAKHKPAAKIADTNNETIMNLGPETAGQFARGADEHLHKEHFGERTEAQILSREPIKVQLGGVEYDIRPAVVRVAKAFAEKRAENMLAALKMGKIDTDDPEAFAAGYARVAGGVTDQLDLICLYASEIGADKKLVSYLPQSQIEETATAEEVSIVFEKVVRLAESPLARATAIM